MEAKNRKKIVPFFEALLMDPKLIRWCQTAWDETYYQELLKKQLFPGISIPAVKPKRCPLIPEVERLVAEQQMEI